MPRDGRSRAFPGRLAFCAAALVLAAAPRAGAKPPNVVVILADDLGYSDLGCYGGEIATPNLDRLAANGLRFTQFYNTARCWPSRAALLSGYYAQQVNRDPANERPKWAALLPDLLRPAGYRSYHSGKWHVDGPVLAAGFERSYEVVDPDRHFGPKDHRLDDKPLPPPEPGGGYYSTTAVASRAIDWIDGHERDHKGEPFFLYVAFLSPHFPVQAPAGDVARYRGRYDAGWDAVRADRLARQKALGLYQGELSTRDPETVPGWNLSGDELRRRVGPGEVGRAVAWDALSADQKAFQAAKMAAHAAMVDRMDREVGRVLDRLRAAGGFDDTLVLFASDNGASAEQILRGDGHDPASTPGSAGSYLGIGPGWSTAANTPFRLHKSWNHEGGVSTPFIVHWPAGLAARGALRKTPAHLIDVAPTLLELAGLPAPGAFGGEARPPWPGRSLVPALAGDVALGRDVLFFKHAGNRALRAGDWKVVSAGPDGPWELYDLASDRAENHDLAAAHPGKVKELAALWDRADEEYRRQGATGRTLPRPGASKKAAR